MSSSATRHGQHDADDPSTPANRMVEGSRLLDGNPGLAARLAPLPKAQADAALRAYLDDLPASESSSPSS